ncbi:MAG: tRNA uridine-5-carboxymethylaminomethyl(34) synthesis GTPase MnmE [Treponema sp.]|nr:tRNA uridine-5-carboxymethylaminomethyl(34) synthesis GTPase MnmE [Treponema sp.]
MASYGDDDPIAAFATIPGNSALTLIRCSGKGSQECAAAIFSAPRKLLQAAGNTIIRGWIVTPDAAELVDDVLLSVFRAPKSYTGEDSLDISCHGGIAAGGAVMAALRSAGFRDALPGEFTFRAFMNGKIDLTRSESVMELVSAKTDMGRHHAVHRLSGVLEQEINCIKKKLIEVLAAAEIYLDYSEDEISTDNDEIAGRLPKRTLALESLARLQVLSQSWQRQQIYQEGILAVIAGRTNAGKSSLFNLLLKEERSIVTDIPGTTRDWIEAWVSIEGIPVRLADTAGLRESADPVEIIGIERSRDLLEAAELILYVVDGEAGLTAEDRSFIEKMQCNKRLLVLWNKSDIAPLPEDLISGAFLSVSAKTGKGIAELTLAITAAITGEQGAHWQSDAASVGTARQKNLVDAAILALQEALHLAEREEPLDIIAPMLREAVNSLGEITGEVSTADILEEMFSKFCVGK